MRQVTSEDYRAGGETRSGGGVWNTCVRSKEGGGRWGQVLDLLHVSVICFINQMLHKEVYWAEGQWPDENKMLVTIIYFNVM